MRIFPNIFILFTCLQLAQASDLIPPDEIKKNALSIDKLVAANFKTNKIKVPEVTNDSTFMRRAFLVSVGRIPTPKEALQFIELEHPDKRELLVDYLYQSSGYKSHMQNWLFDLLTLRDFSGPAEQDNNQPLIHWVKDAVETNMAWDDFCKKLLTTKGNAWSGSGAAGYFAKDKSMQEDNLSNTMRVFTGIRLECAQCHDDPFQEWERMDFYQLNAFVNGDTTLKTVRNSTRGGRDLQKLQSNMPEKYDVRGLGSIFGFNRILSYKADYGVTPNKGLGRVKLPGDYQYNDGDPGEYVGGRAPFGGKIRTSRKKHDEESIDKFAEWMTSDDTPQFAQTIAMRLWERVMGISLTPVTGDYVEPKDTNFRQLIIYLSKLAKEYDYDMRVFQKTLMMTRTFQFVSSPKDLINGEKNALDGRRSSRMSAEQIWDSLLSLSAPDPDKLDKRERPYELYMGNKYIMPVREYVNKANAMNGAQFQNFVIDTYEKLRDGIAITDKEPKHGPYPSSGPGGFSTALQGLVRASELMSPAPSDHFLSVFGQSTRKSAIDEASKEGAVSQALEMLNGSVQRLIVHNKDASVNQVLRQIKDSEQRIRTIFLVVLNRTPDTEEMQMCLDLLEISDDPEDAYRNLVAGLVASQEFYFIF